MSFALVPGFGYRPASMEPNRIYLWGALMIGLVVFGLISARMLGAL